MNMYPQKTTMYKKVLFSVRNETLEVQECDHLGQVVSADPTYEKGIWYRIGKGWGALGKQAQMTKSKLPPLLKRKVHNRCVRQVMIYGAETWHLTRQLESKLGSAQWAAKRRMRGVMLRERKRASRVREQTRVDDITVQVKKKKFAV